MLQESVPTPSITEVATAAALRKMSTKDASASDGDSDPTALAGPSIVVLPFSYLSKKQNEVYLADGVAEELIVRFAQVRGLLYRRAHFFVRV